MTESDLKLIDFHVTDITCHVNTGVSEELPMSIKSSVSARMPEEFDGSLYIYLKTTITGQDESLFLLDVLGVLMMLVSVFLWSTASIIIRRISGRYDPMQIALIAICCALPLTGAWSLIELQSAACSFSAQSVLAVLYMGIFGTAVTHSLWNYSLRVMDASFCSMFYPMQPLVSAILGVLFLHETVTPSFILGALMICGGIVAAVKSAPK